MTAQIAILQNKAAPKGAAYLNESYPSEEVQSLFESSPTQCSKYDSCSVPVCPLDHEWRSRSHLRGEASCHYLRLAVKDCATPDEQVTPAYQAAVQLWAQKDQLPPALLKQLEKASSLNRKAIPLIQVDPERAAIAMKRLEKVFGEADRPISRFI